MLQRLASTCFRRRWIVLGVWVVVLFGLNVLANGVIGSNFRTDFKLPDTESRTVFQLLEKANPDRSGTTSQIVFQDASGVNTPEVQQAMDRGCYIALEGSEGSGKSTHARRLAVELDAVLTFEHGGTPIGKLVRAILADPANSEMTDKTEALLIAADRAQHIEQVVRPALEAGRNVVSDRSIYSSLAYQGYGRGLPLDEVRAVNEWAIDGCWPDLVVLLDVPGEQLAHRMSSERLSVHFTGLPRVIAAFAAIRCST